MKEYPPGFDPEKHRMLGDSRSWVLQEVPEHVFTPREVINQYNALVDRVVSANPDLTIQQAYDRVLQVERVTKHHFFGHHYDTSTPSSGLARERRRLIALRRLNLLTTEEEQELNLTEASFRNTIDQIVNVTGDSPEETEHNVETVLLSNLAQDLQEARRIILEGPIIRGFEETEDPQIPNKLVEQFLKDAFGSKALRRARLGSVEKDDKWGIHFRHPEERVRLGNRIVEAGLAVFGGDTAESIYVCPNREAYFEAEMILEEVDDPSLLKHLYKIRATAGNAEGFHIVRLHNFGTESPQDYDYLRDLPLSEEDKLRALILGTVSHEVAHRYKNRLPKELFKDYQEIMEEEAIPTRRKYVSDYALRHEEVYESPSHEILNEDFVETVRIYMTNPDFLQQNYPRRYEFIERNFPFMKRGAVLEAIKDLSKTADSHSNQPHSSPGKIGEEEFNN